MKLKHEELSFEQLKRSYDLKGFTCETTETVPQIKGMIGQDRAIRAIEFGLNIDSPGYNIYVAGLSDTGRTSTVERILRELAAKKGPPNDWCYVHNFQDPDQPRSIGLPPDKGRQWQKEMKDLIESLRTEIPKTFETKDYKERSSKISETYEDQKRQLLSDMEKKARERGFQIKRTPLGFAPVPLKSDGEPLSEKEFQKLGLEERKRIEENMKSVQKEIKQTFEQFTLLDRKSKEELTKFNKEVALFVVGYRIDNLKAKYKDYPDVLHHLDEVRADLVENVDDFLKAQEEPSFLGVKIPTGSPFIKYEVNVVVDNSHIKGAPVIMETNPTYSNMFGRVEKKAQLGALITDFTKIKAGSVLKANGGYLVVDAEGVLILSGYLGGKHGSSMPLSLSATLTFEQSYSFVEGDSASSTELFAILSSLSELPIKQGIAVTGSVNQWGEIQPIGGVNQKIEGFFDEGMEILTGVKAGERGKDGSFPEKTVNGRVQNKLKYLMKEQAKLKKEAEAEAE